MNKLFQAAGLLSVGAASFSSLGGLTAVAEETKPWGVSASVKAFYDDNINTSRGTTPKTDSVGLDISPSIHLKTDLGGNKLGFDYDFGARYFENRAGEKFDIYHTLNATAERAFSNDVRVSLQDNFKISQEPEVLNGGAPVRTKGDNLRNLARGSLDYGFAPNLSAVLEYSNTYFNYDDPAYQGLLGRIEHLPGLTLRYKLAESTYTSLGYQYGVVDYDGKRAIDFFGHTANVRDNTSHYVFAGVDHIFSPELKASARAGGQFVSYDNVKGRDTSSPYADANLSYTYMQGGTATVGVRHQRNATDVADPNATTVDGLTLDQISTAVYFLVRQDITQDLTLNGLLQWQNSEFNGGNSSYNGKTEDYITLGAGASYRINTNFSIEANYAYDHLSSVKALVRDYSRNRIFLGVRFTY